MIRSRCSSSHPRTSANFAAEAFDSPDRSIGAATEIAGDSRTVPQLREAFSRVWGVNVRPLPFPRFFIRRMGDLGLMLEWFGRGGYAVDVPAMRAAHPWLTTFEQWLERNRPR